MKVRALNAELFRGKIHLNGLTGVHCAEISIKMNQIELKYNFGMCLETVLCYVESFGTAHCSDG